MKNPIFVLAVVFAFSASSAYAVPMNLNNFYMVTGGMGIDGATNRADPLLGSPQQALAIYEALDVQAESNGDKSAGVRHKGETIGLTCQKAKKGCDLLVVLPKAEMKKAGGFNESLSFSGAAADGIFEALPQPTGNQPVGASTRRAGNLMCSRVVAPRAQAKCTLVNINYVGFTMAELIKTSEGKFTRSQAEAMIRAADLRTR